MVALLAQLAAGCAPVPIERNRRSGTSAEDAPCLVLSDGSHTPDSSEAFGETAYEMTCFCDGTVTAADDAALGSALSGLYAQAVVAAMSDPTIGDTAADIQESGFDVRIPEVEESSAPLAFFSLTFLVRFRTQYGDPYS